MTEKIATRSLTPYVTMQGTPEELAAMTQEKFFAAHQPPPKAQTRDTKKGEKS